MSHLIKINAVCKFSFCHLWYLKVTRFSRSSILLLRVGPSLEGLLCPRKQTASLKSCVAKTKKYGVPNPLMLLH